DESSLQLGTAPDRLESVSHRLEIAGAHAQDLDPSDDRRERRAQLVGEDEKELVLRAIGFVRGFESAAQEIFLEPQRREGVAQLAAELREIFAGAGELALHQLARPLDRDEPRNPQAQLFRR